MSCEVMRTLRENDGTSLVIRWNDSEEIVIPAGKAQPAESQRIDYPLSLLAELYADVILTKPNTGEVVDPNKPNPSTGGVWENGETPELAGKSEEKENANVFQPESQVHTSGGTVLLIAILVVLAAAAAGYVWHRNSKTNE